MSDIQSPCKTLRFWTWLNGGYVRIKIKPDQMLAWCRTETTEEGWESEGESWFWDTQNNLLKSDVYSAGVDCDGRVENQRGFCCSPWDLEHRDSGNPSIKYPNWKEESAFQRDYEAERAGY